MKLTRTERLILVNQIQILEYLDPDQKEDLAYQRKALQRGYELHYDDVFQEIDDDTMSDDQCQLVVDILDMHRALTFSLADLADKSGIKEDDVKFRGFDGNEETRYFAYAKYFCSEPPTGRFTELGSVNGFNSHRRMLGRYKAMLAEYKKSQDEHSLTREDILRIIGVKA